MKGEWVSINKAIYMITVIPSSAKKQFTYGEINLDDPSITTNENEKKTVEVEKFYKWSF